MMKKLKVAVLFGGKSSEYKISLMSASSVLEHMDTQLYDCFMIGITKSGDFYLYEGDITSILNDTWMRKNVKKITFSTNATEKGFYFLGSGEFVPVDIVFPVLHGKNGEDGTLQGLLELIEIPYVGCDMLSSALCMDKFLAHTLVSARGIDVPKSMLFSTYDIPQILKCVRSVSLPVFVKPVCCGSSFGVKKVNSFQELEAAITLAFSYDSRIVVEEAIDGFEVGCAILGTDSLIVGEVDEIEIPSGFFDYEEKYTLKNSKIFLPARISFEERNRICEIAKEIYQILGCQGFARVDMFYTPDKRIVFNEVNTIPGFTAHSRYPSMMKEVGFDYEKIISELIRLGMKR